MIIYKILFQQHSNQEFNSYTFLLDANQFPVYKLKDSALGQGLIQDKVNTSSSFFSAHLFHSFHLMHDDDDGSIGLENVMD